MKITLKNLLYTAITLDLISGSAIAESKLAGEATNPIANLVQLQIQDYYVADSYNADGDSNLFIVQPVIPIKLSSEAVPLLVTRTTLAYVSTPDIDGVGTKEGFGDLVAQGYFIPKLETKGVMVGVGYNLTVPTAGGKKVLKNVYFGEQHLHTAASPDAFAVGTRGTWDDAYRYAKGEEVKLSTTGKKIRKKISYDFVVITDHSEYFGVMTRLIDPEAKLVKRANFYPGQQAYLP